VFSEDPPYSAAEVDAGLAALREPGRLAHAQEVVMHAFPTLQRILGEALEDGGWFGAVHDAEVSRACGEPDDQRRAQAVSTLVAEQTRLGMFVGVAVGFELAHELQRARGEEHGITP
jgi:hypothetical protein